jgi:hypothetical protein
MLQFAEAVDRMGGALDRIEGAVDRIDPPQRPVLYIVTTRNEHGDA